MEYQMDIGTDDMKWQTPSRICCVKSKQNSCGGRGIEIGREDWVLWSICDIVTVMSPYITLRHKLWEQGLLAAIKYFQDQAVSGQLKLKSTFQFVKY